MKITVFTSNQPRHLALIEELSKVSEVTYAIQECTTVFPGQVEDFYGKSDIMQQYFVGVLEAESKLFGAIRFSPPNVRTLTLKTGDLSKVHKDVLAEALESDLYVVFGASYIKGWLIDFLVQRRAINIHMGLSPYYRGTACNFWAMYDRKPEYVGATIHLLSKGLDSGAILYHALPKFETENRFEFTMRAVKCAHTSLVQRIRSGELFHFRPQNQNRALELRYSRRQEFTDDVAREFLMRTNEDAKLAHLLQKAKRPELLHPFFD